MLSTVIVRYRRPLVVTLHMALIPLGYFLAYLLRFDVPIPEGYTRLFWFTLPLLVLLRMSAFALFGLFQGWWRHAGMTDLVSIVKAVTVSSAIFVALIYFMDSVVPLPRSVIVIDWGIAIIVLGGARLSVRGVREGYAAWRNGHIGSRTLIIGAGEAGEHLLRQLLRTAGGAMSPVGLVDDDPSKHGLRLHGVPVLGSTEDLKALARHSRAELLVIAMPSAVRDEMKRIVERCMDTGVEFKIVPSMKELLDGTAKLNQIRSVEVEDLLGRAPISLDLDAVATDLCGRVILVTGGAGSIGSELARQVAGFRPKRLILLEQAESPLYFAHLELTRKFPGLNVVPVIADVADRGRLEEVFATHRPDYVFHAAAYKHVPLMEANVVEAVRNNVLGTLHTAECAAKNGAQKFVLISTDKAVNPSSIMGATKRIAERIVLGWPSLREAATDFRAVRFGNVLGSDGSVIPLFRKQLAAGGPLTVTHPEVTRYFMTIPEAVQLVLQASALPEAARRISMLEMGRAIRIVDLAENLLRLSGLEPYHDVPIVFTGLRPGEKLYEELMSDVEETVPTSMEKILIVQSDEPAGEILQHGLDRLCRALATGDVSDLVLEVCAFVPECVSPLRDRGTEAARVPEVPG